MPSKFYDAEDDADKDNGREEPKSKSQNSESSSTSTQSTDWERRYKGLARKMSDRDREDAAREAEYDRVVALNAQLETRNRELEKAATSGTKEWEDRAAKAEKELVTLQKQIAVQTVTSKFPALADMLVDLKSADQFEKPEDYEAYLTKINDRLGAQTKKPDPEPEPEVQQQQSEAQLKRPDFDRRAFLNGTTPTISANANGGGKGQRTVDEILNDMGRLDSRKPDYATKYPPLEAELNAAMARQQQ